MLASSDLPRVIHCNHMQTVKDKAIILRRKPMGEADLMLTLYTEKNGKVRVIAKGARKITSKLLGYTELFTLISCQINFRSSIPIISQISHEKLFDGVGLNKELYSHLHIVAELVDRGCEDHETNATLFYVLEESMNRLVQSDHPLVVPSILLRVSTILGFAPQLTLCAYCGEPIETPEAIGWSNLHGGMVTCEAGLARSELLTVDEAKVLRYLARTRLSETESLKIPAVLGQRIQGLLLTHIQQSLEQQFLSVK